MLPIPADRRRAWSPWLHIEVTSDESHGTLLVCRFSPHPSIWTGVMLSGLALLTLIVFAIGGGLAQQIVGQTPTAWYVAVVCAAAVGVLWIGSQAAQRLARDQMRELADELAKALREDPLDAVPSGTR